MKLKEFNIREIAKHQRIASYLGEQGKTRARDGIET